MRLDACLMDGHGSKMGFGEVATSKSTADLNSDASGADSTVKTWAEDLAEEAKVLLSEALSTCGPRHWITAKLAALRWTAIFALPMSTDDVEETLRCLEVFTNFVQESCPALEW